MSARSLPVPVHVRSPRGASVSEIEWSDGRTLRYPHRVLRGLCPCAECQGHDGGIRWVDAVEGASAPGLELAELEQVGNYALGLTWQDGHSGGIYAFEYLLELGKLERASIEQLRAVRLR